MAESLWTKEDVESLKRMWALGWSGVQMSKALGGRHSRNGCIGKANRLKLSPRDNSFNREYHHRTKPQLYIARPKSPPKPVVLTDEPTPIGPIGELPDGSSCRYIFGDVQTKDWRCCAAPVTKGSYCDHHHARCATPPQPRRA